MSRRNYMIINYADEESVRGLFRLLDKIEEVKK
jgi:hypothetical protein